MTMQMISNIDKFKDLKITCNETYISLFKVNWVCDEVYIYMHAQLLSKVPDRIWNLMYCNALEYYTVLPVAPSFDDVHLLQNEAEDVSENLKVESIDDDDNDDLSEDTNQFQAPLESFHLTSHQVPLLFNLKLLSRSFRYKSTFSSVLTSKWADPHLAAQRTPGPLSAQQPFVQFRFFIFV